jgi:hypothetical protein
MVERQLNDLGILALVLVVGGQGMALAADSLPCRELRQKQEAMTTSALEWEIDLARSIRARLCPQLAARAVVANARDLQFAPIDYGAWSRCRLQAERSLAATHPVRYRNRQGFPFYSREGAVLAGQADGLLGGLEGRGCQGEAAR